MTAIYAASGTWIDLERPGSVAYQIEDIARGLSQQCRFAGQTSRFYSVAEHSVLVSYLVPAPYALAGLLHDASEAFLCDIPKPIKVLPALAGYRFLEEQVEAAILEYFGVPGALPVPVKRADTLLACHEARSLFAEPPAWALDTDTSHLPALACLNPGAAREAFLARFAVLVR